jgi:hypothetical protein
MHIKICLLADRELYGREYWMIYRGPGFLGVVWFGSSPTPYLPFQLAEGRPGTKKEDWERETTCWREMERSRRIIRQRESMALCKSFNTLCCTVRSQGIEEGNTKVNCWTSHLQGSGSLCRLYSTKSTLTKTDTVALLFFAFFKIWRWANLVCCFVLPGGVKKRKR